MSARFSLAVLVVAGFFGLLVDHSTALVSSRQGCSGPAFGDELTREKSALAQVQQGSPEALTLAVEVDRPISVFLPGQDRTTRVMRVTVGQDVTAIVWKASKLPDHPKFYPPHAAGYEGGDYDAQGNLLLSMPSEGATLCDHISSEEYSETLAFRVAQDGTAQAMASVPSLSRRRAADLNTVNLNLLRRILWALGRPRAEGLGEVVVEEGTPDGTKRVRATGWWSGAFAPGVCELVIEHTNGYLVREAKFLRAEGESPAAECRCDGARRFGEIVFAERGEFKIPSLETIRVRLLSLSLALDTDLIAEARAVVSRARTRLVRVIDERDDPAQPKVRLVPAGDLDKDE